MLGDSNSFRLLIFLFVFLGMALFEVTKPCRSLKASKSQRWFINVSLVILGRVLVYFVTLFLPALFAIQLERSDWGLFGLLRGPLWFEVLLSLVLLDCAIYAQHVVLHKVPLLWRLHKVHHTDLDLDVTSGFRFHPLEIGLSLFVKLGMILLIVPPIEAVVLFEITLSSLALFNHSNVSLPKGFEKGLRLLIVTPDMHRIHHSSIQIETNSNYGFNLSVWDKIFRTYTKEPKLGQKKLEIGLKEYRQPDELGLIRILGLPFENQKT